MYLVALGHVFLYTLYFAGVTVFAYFASIGCDPVSDGAIGNYNQVNMFMILKVFSQGATQLITAGFSIHTDLHCPIVINLKYTLLVKLDDYCFRLCRITSCKC